MASPSPAVDRSRAERWQCAAAKPFQFEIHLAGCAAIATAEKSVTNEKVLCMLTTATAVSVMPAMFCPASVQTQSVNCHLIKEVGLGAPDFWDYVGYDAPHIVHSSRTATG